MKQQSLFSQNVPSVFRQKVIKQFRHTGQRQVRPGQLALNLPCGTVAELVLDGSTSTLVRVGEKLKLMFITLHPS